MTSPITFINHSVLDRLEKKPAELTTLLKNFPKPEFAACESPNVRDRLLRLVAQGARTLEANEGNDFFLKTIQAFRKTFGLPTNISTEELGNEFLLFPNGAMWDRENILIFSDKLLSLTSNFSQVIPPVKNNKNHYIVPLSAEALKIFQHYLYEGKLQKTSIAVLKELTSFAKKIRNEELLEQVVESRLSLLLAEENSAHLTDPSNVTFLTNYSRKFTTEYLKKRNIKTLAEIPYIKITLSDFAALFIDNGSEEKKVVLKTIAREIGAIEVDNIDCFSVIPLIDKKYRRAILLISTELSDDPQFMQNVIGPKVHNLQLFPNVEPSLLFPIHYHPSFTTQNPRAFEILTEVAKEYPRATYLLQIYGENFPDEKTEFYKYANSINPKDPFVIQKYVGLAEQQDSKLLEKAIKVNPKELSLYASLIPLLLLNHQDAKLIKVLQACIRRFPDQRAKFTLYLGRAFFNVGQYKKAKKFLCEALNNEFDPGVFHEFCLCCAKLKEYTEAIDWLQKIIKILREKLAQGQEESDRHHLQEQLNKLLNVLGYFYLHNEDFDLVEQCIKEANASELLESSKYQIDTNTLSTNYAFLGASYLKRGKLLEAQVTLDKACEIQKNNFWALSYSGDHANTIGEYITARQRYLQMIGISGFEKVTERLFEYKNQLDPKAVLMHLRLEEVIANCQAMDNLNNNSSIHL